MPFTPTCLSQRDPQWKDEKLGFDNTVTIGTDGCALTCLTMLVNGYGFNETPSSLNQKLKAMGNGAGFLGSLIVWGGLSRAFPKIIFQRIIVCHDQPAPMNDINASLRAGQPVVVEVDRSPAPGLQNHWVVLYGRQGDDYLMLDPWPHPADNKPTTLVARFGQGRQASQFITAAVWYQAAATAAPNVPPPGTGLLVRVQDSATAGLRLRSAPDISALAITVEPAGTLLRCLEADAAVLPKIGVNGQWLQVVDPGGQTGYVAAWYVDKMGGSTPVPPASQPATPSALTVSVSSQASAGLRLREQPNATANTIKILAAGTSLQVLEPAGAALAKIGVNNQWLNVKEPGGQAGYVAAWYVQKK